VFYGLWSEINVNGDDDTGIARDGDGFTAMTVVIAPAVMSTICYISFRASAVNIVQPHK